jgi:hypothetical protein
MTMIWSGVLLTLVFFKRNLGVSYVETTLQLFCTGHGEVIPLTILHFGPWAEWSFILRTTGG